jgi:hypothetical protein
MSWLWQHAQGFRKLGAMEMRDALRMNSKSAISILATITCVLALLGRVLETYFDRSFTTLIYASFLLYLVAVAARSRNFQIKKSVLIVLICNSFYAINYFLIGPGSYLMIQTLIVCIGVPLLYNAMVIMNYDVLQVWNAFKKIQIAIYCSLIVEFVIAILGYQSALEAAFQPSSERPSLAGYFSLHNSFAAYFDLGFVGLKSLALTYQAYGQFCVMLTIFGFRYLKRPFNPFKSIVFVIAPIALSLVSPNATAVAILVSIIVAMILIKAYLNLYSPLRVLVWFLTLPIALYIVYASNLGFVRTYDLELFYLVYVAPQMDYVLSRSIIENVIGVDARIFEELRQQFEVALLSFMSATGSVFFVLNLSLVVFLIFKNLQQIKFLHKERSCSNEYLEVQIMNLLFVISMLVSTIHFPVISTYIGSMIFVMNLSLGFYIVHTNKQLIKASLGNQAKGALSARISVQKKKLVSAVRAPVPI